MKSDCFSQLSESTDIDSLESDFQIKNSETDEGLDKATPKVASINKTH